MSLLNLATFALAMIICAVGIGALIGHALRPNPADRLLLWVGVFSVIYGVRMLFKQPLAPALGVRPSTGLWVENGLNYFILIPLPLFVEELYGFGWHRLLRWATFAMSGVAVAAICVDVVAGDSRRVPDPSPALVVAFMLIVVVGRVKGYQPRRFSEWRILVAGSVIFLLFVLDDHAVGARIVPWRYTAEPVGFLIQLGCFGYIALSRVFDQGRQLAAVDVAAKYSPLAAVAGDFYDVIALKHGAIATLIADVSGHGVPAALIASMVKVAFAAALRESGDPAAILHSMNTTLCGMFERSYVTAVCAVVEPDTNALKYAVAGHPPPLLVSGVDGNMTTLEERGLFLGMMPSATYASATVVMSVGSRLILYTDGVTETPNGNDEFFGTDRLVALAEATGRQDGGAFIGDLMAALHRFAGSDDLPHDDVTVVVLDSIGC